MSVYDFEEQIAIILRRLERLRAIQRGDLSVRMIPVKRHFVPGFWVSHHKRAVAFTPKRQPKTKATKRAA